MNIPALRAALSGAALLLSACAPHWTPDGAPDGAPDGTPERAPVVIGPRRAGLLALDALAPAFGGAARPTEADCAMRYAIAALRARCVALAGDRAALVADLPRLRALAAAMAAVGAAAEETRFLAAMDALFDPLAGRSAPSGGVAARDFAAAERRLAALLAAPGPGWGAGSLASVMAADGPALRAAEAAALGPLVAAAEAARADWSAAAARAAAPLRALAAYEASLAAQETEE
ncbi:MAG: hypothetical protein ACE37J_14365 [Pikeienuella sp.]|uniref:hypothetical protein n=1 Tax=Pikeienuella sp. TaxID=2831957 RepID=UPI00391AE77D